MLHQSFCKHARIQLANVLSCGAAALISTLTASLPEQWLSRAGSQEWEPS